MDELSCGWLTYQLVGKETPSRLAVDRLKAVGHSGMFVRSFARGSTEANINLVLWKWQADLQYKVDVYDPTGRRPADQFSWPARSGLK
jgi:RES domain-containing protein